MSHELLKDARLYLALLEFDRDLRDQLKERGCECGGPLHVSDYRRKPRGSPAPLPPDYDRRFSLCCGREGCRQRATPESVRFLGRRVYLGAIFVLVSAMQLGLSARRVTELRRWVGVSRRTLKRWRRWWLEIFRTTPCWKAARGLFRLPVDESRLPRSLLESFEGEPLQQLVAALKLLSPLSVATAGRDATEQGQ